MDLLWPLLPRNSQSIFTLSFSKCLLATPLPLSCCTSSWLSWRLQSFCISQAIYLAAIVTLCIITVILTMAERFATPSFRPLRAGLFVALGCFGILPVRRGPSNPCVRLMKSKKIPIYFGLIFHLSSIISISILPLWRAGLQLVHRYIL